MGSKNLRTPNVIQTVAESDAAVNASGHQLLEAADDSSTADATNSDEQPESAGADSQTEDAQADDQDVQGKEKEEVSTKKRTVEDEAENSEPAAEGAKEEDADMSSEADDGEQTSFAQSKAKSQGEVTPKHDSTKSTGSVNTEPKKAFIQGEHGYIDVSDTDVQDALDEAHIGQEGC